MKRLIFVSCLVILFAGSLTALVSAQENSGFEFKFVCEADNPQCDKIIDSNNQKELWIERTAVLTDKDIEEVKTTVAKIAPAVDDPRLRVIFNEKGKEKLTRVTSQNLKKRLAIFYDGQYLMGPTIMEPIASGEIEIAGPLAMKKSEEIIAKFKKLPTE